MIMEDAVEPLHFTQYVESIMPNQMFQSLHCYIQWTLNPNELTSNQPTSMNIGCGVWFMKLYTTFLFIQHWSLNLNIQINKKLDVLPLLNIKENYSKHFFGIILITTKICNVWCRLFSRKLIIYICF